MSDEVLEDSRCGMPADACPTWADLLGTWRLCRKRACQRGRRCRGEEVACVRTNLPLLPESVQLWFVTMMDSKDAGLSFDEAMDRLEGTWAEEGYVQWRKAIGQPVTVSDT